MLRRLTVERLAFGALLLLAVAVGLGDIAEVTSVDALVLNGVRSLLPLAIGLTILARLVAHHRLPAFPQSMRLPFAAWLLVLLVSATLAPTNRADALAALERPTAGVLLAWSTYALCKTRQRWLGLARAIALGGLAIAVVGLAEASGVAPVEDWLASLHSGKVPIGDVPRIASTLSHPNVAAMLLELSLPLVVAWIWTAARHWRGPLAAGALGNALAMVLTFSRAGIVAGLAALTVMAGLSVVHGERRRLLILLVVALAVPTALASAALTDPGLDRRLTAELTPARPPLSSTHDEDPATTVNTPPQPTRFQYWLVAWEMLRDYPWLGVGPDNYRWRFTNYSGVAADDLGVHAHDQYFEALADTGVLGLLTLGWLLVGLLRGAVEGVRSSTVITIAQDWPWRAGVLASLSAWLVHAVLDDFERFWPASVAFWLIAGLCLRVPGVQAHAQRLNSQKTAPTTTIRTTSTRIPPGLASAAPPPPPPPKLTMSRLSRACHAGSSLSCHLLWAGTPLALHIRQAWSTSARIDELEGRTMGERMHEIKGDVKKGVGKLTGDEELEAEGRAEHDTAHAAREAKGVGNQVKGSVQEGLGKVTGDEDIRARGAANRLKGDAERTG